VLTDELHNIQYLDEVRSSDLEGVRIIRKRLGYSNQTIKHTIGVIRGVIKYAKRMGYQVPEVEFPSISVPTGKLRYLSFEEEKQKWTPKTGQRLK